MLDPFFAWALLMLVILFVFRHYLMWKHWGYINVYELSARSRKLGEHMNFKLWLDDERPAPKGWTLVKGNARARHILRDFHVKAISLDHDLGMGEEDGYYILRYLEEEAHAGRYVPDEIYIHTANPPARLRMQAALDNINRIKARQNMEAKSFHIDRHESGAFAGGTW